jgi:NAD(P)-dependent dehydrogenase (short-subunit alcohol dehydrogenase family)
MGVVVITGTSSGIGLAVALHFARRDDEVYATMRDLERGAALREAAAQEHLPLTLLQLDVTDQASVQQAIGEVLVRAGQVDVLINNAGIGVGSPLEQADEALLWSGFATNVVGPLRTMQAVLPSMRARGQGAIVNVTSIAGRFSLLPGAGFYHATKYALEALSEVLALEVAPLGIRVAIIEPGLIETPLVDLGRAIFPEKGPSPFDASFEWFNRRGEDSQLVAEVIERALTAPEPRLRWPVGPDAEALVAARQRMSDEEWLDLVRAFGQDGFLQQFIANFARA